MWLVAAAIARTGAFDTEVVLTEVFIAGLLRDLASTLPTCGGVVAAMMVVFAIRHRAALAWYVPTGFSDAPSPPCSSRGLFSGFCRAARRGSDQRGLDPTWFDFKLAWADVGFVSSAARVFLFQRHLVQAAQDSSRSLRCSCGSVRRPVVALR